MDDKLEELLKLTKENNMLLKAILAMLQRNESNDFMTNVAANIFADWLERRKLKWEEIKYMPL